MKRLLIAGFGDIARRAAPALEQRFTLIALCRSRGSDLDRTPTLSFAPPDMVLHLAPPQPAGEEDLRTRNLLAALDRAGVPPERFVYVSTSGVYGDCGGALVDESRAPAPATGRSKRRWDAERQLLRWCAERRTSLIVLRAPGIYAADRLPLERIAERSPVLIAEEDVYTNHIHADDLAAICVRALEADAPAGTYNASDDSAMKMGEWLDLVADSRGLARPPRAPRAEVAHRVPAVLLTFMSESRRLDNSKLKRELGIRLRYPTVYQGLKNEDAIGIH